MSEAFKLFSQRLLNCSVTTEKLAHTKKEKERLMVSVYIIMVFIYRDNELLTSNDSVQAPMTCIIHFTQQQPYRQVDILLVPSVFATVNKRGKVLLATLRQHFKWPQHKWLRPLWVWIEDIHLFLPQALCWRESGKIADLPL